MKIAVISDIHGNLEALQKALQTIQEQPVDQIVCLGDIVGYGANPSECVDLIRENCVHIVKGNHDEAVTNENDMDKFNPYAVQSILWTRDQLNGNQLSFLKQLPKQISMEGLRFVHATADEHSDWDYVFTHYQALRQFDFFKEPICFYGHTHIPTIFPENRHVSDILKDERYVINVGSIGQPRDNNILLSFGIFDTAIWNYENMRVDYDVETASNKIRSAGLPVFLADRLLHGR
jgi:predicted phosphodiesterase